MRAITRVDIRRVAELYYQAGIRHLVCKWDAYAMWKPCRGARPTDFDGLSRMLGSKIRAQVFSKFCPSLVLVSETSPSKLWGYSFKVEERS